VAYSEGKVVVHYFKPDLPARTEAWSRMERVKSFKGGITVRFCKEVSENQAYVGISSSSSGSQYECDKADEDPLD